MAASTPIPARGRYAPRAPVEDPSVASPAVVDLDRERPDAAAFIRRIEREMRIRFYQQKSVKSYRNALGRFFRWSDMAPSDIRFIQKLLGHVKLETTTLYTHVAHLAPRRIEGPLGLIARRDPQPVLTPPAPPEATSHPSAPPEATSHPSAPPGATSHPSARLVKVLAVYRDRT